MSLSPVLLDHFKAPRNAGRVDRPTGRGRAVNEGCGDVIEIEVRVAGGRIEAVAFLAQGCSASIACASYATEKAKGLAVPAALALDADALLREVDEAAPARRHGMTQAIRALREALRAPV